MTDYKEEQANEIEALESIYSDEFQVLSSEPCYCFQVSVTSQSEKEDVDNANVILEFTFPDTYPDEVPVSEVKDYENIEDEDVEVLQQLLKEQAEENVGVVMVFTLVSAVQEKLTEIVQSIAQQIQDKEEQKQRAIEEAEQKRFVGTQVTIETFLAWKTKFDAEMMEARRLRGDVDKNKSKKLTGKELFLADHSLDDSDVKFLEEDGDSVAVDESLFQDMEDLDLDDDPEGS